LDAARHLLLAALLFPGLALPGLWLDATLRPVLGVSGKIDPGAVHGVSGLCLVPSGSHYRNPETRIRGVDLRFCPALPRIETDPAGFFFPEPRCQGDRPLSKGRSVRDPAP